MIFWKQLRFTSRSQCPMIQEKPITTTAYTRLVTSLYHWTSARAEVCFVYILSRPIKRLRIMNACPLQPAERKGLSIMAAMFRHGHSNAAEPSSAKESARSGDMPRFQSYAISDGSHIRSINKRSLDLDPKTPSISPPDPVWPSDPSDTFDPQWPPINLYQSINQCLFV